MTLKFTILGLLISSVVWSQRVEVFTGTAKLKGSVVYTEKHEVSFDAKDKILEAKTVYLAPDGKVLGTLNSDFRKSLSLPEHVFYDERTKGSYGVRRVENKIVLFNQDAGKAEQVLELKENKDKDRIEVGCQGFSYFLRDKIDSIKNNKSLPVLFMVPGDLSTYKFILELIKEHPDQIFDFKVKIENWFLRAFAPELEFKYDQKTHRIIWYKGISNLKSEDGKNMNVEIDYTY